VEEVKLSREEKRNEVIIKIFDWFRQERRIVNISVKLLSEEYVAVDKEEGAPEGLMLSIFFRGRWNINKICGSDTREEDVFWRLLSDEDLVVNDEISAVP